MASIGSYAFGDCIRLAKVTIGNGVTSIGDWAFAFCGFTSVVIPDNVVSIGWRAFAYCGGLTSIIIPDNVTSIGDSAFEGCSRLTSVTIGNGVTYIGYNVFDDCSGLTDIYYAGTKTEWNAIDKSSVGISENATIHYNYESGYSDEGRGS